ncbi:MAG: hypothetical protein HYV00_04380 [Deltaproteobacteria bacterium]|nr:hypothetical protein [Deltaproteobacteria bacterium]
MKTREVSIDVMLPSCPCCSARLEQELAAAAGVERAGIKFTVPLRAQLRYDPAIARLDGLVDALRERGCEVVQERAEFKIPHRPALPRGVWKVKVENLSRKLDGVISASISFEHSRITVDYLPGVISAREVREAVLGWGVPHPDFERKWVSQDESAWNQGSGLEPQRVRGGDLHAVHSVGPGVSRPCHDEDLGGAAAGV